MAERLLSLRLEDVIEAIERLRATRAEKRLGARTRAEAS